MKKKRFIDFILLFILCIAVVCGTTSCSSKKAIYGRKKAPEYKSVRNNKPKWSYTQNNRTTKYVIKNHKRKKHHPY